jgi:hypothetical protein
VETERSFIETDAAMSMMTTLVLILPCPNSCPNFRGRLGLSGVVSSNVVNSSRSDRLLPKCAVWFDDNSRFSRPSDSSALASLQLGFRGSKPVGVLISDLTNRFE